MGSSVGVSEGGMAPGKEGHHNGLGEGEAGRNQDISIEKTYKG